MKRKSCPITRRGSTPTRFRPRFVLSQPRPKTGMEALATGVATVLAPLAYAAVTGRPACGCVEDIGCVCFYRQKRAG